MWDFHVSHSHLLIRSGGGRGKENVDLIFAGVEYVEVANILRGIAIRLNQDRTVMEALGKKSGIQRSCTGLKAFEIKSNGRLFYVFAVRLFVFVNVVDPTESPLGIHCVLEDESWRQYVRQHGRKLYWVTNNANGD